MINLTTSQRITLDSLTVVQVAQVYSGKPGCACGCNGNYRVNSAYVAQVAKNKGYAVDAEDVNDAQVTRVLNKLKAASRNDDPRVSSWMADDNDEWFSAEIDGRVYTVYTIAYLGLSMKAPKVLFVGGFDAKDAGRIANIVARAGGDVEKSMRLAENMAATIMDAAKAERRMNAARAAKRYDLAFFFSQRLMQLKGGR